MATHKIFERGLFIFFWKYNAQLLKKNIGMMNIGKLGNSMKIDFFLN